MTYINDLHYSAIVSFTFKQKKEIMIDTILS